MVNIPLFIGFQASFWWCRISQPSTVTYRSCRFIPVGWLTPATSSENRLTRPGKRLHHFGKIHHFNWVNPLFLWPFSIAFCMFTRPGRSDSLRCHHCRGWKIRQARWTWHWRISPHEIPWKITSKSPKESIVWLVKKRYFHHWHLPPKVRLCQFTCSNRMVLTTRQVRSKRVSIEPPNCHGSTARETRMVPGQSLAKKNAGILYLPLWLIYC